MTKPAIGFIGLGLMGTAMCDRLLDLGYELHTMANRSRENLERLKLRGANEFQSPKAIAEASQIIMICVDTSASVEARMYADDGVLAGLQAGSVVIDFGTSLPTSTQKIAKDVAAAGSAYLDSPIGRTPAHAREGKINLMAAGDKAAFDKVEPVLKDLGENVFHLGDTGSGHAVKLINNFYVQSTANAMSEAFVMADRFGVDRQDVYDVMRAGPGGSIMMDLVKAYAIDSDPEALSFSVKNAQKDLGYYNLMVKDLGYDSLMVQGALDAMTQAIEKGRGETMVSEQVDFFDDLYS